MKNKITILIPARMESSRFPGKPLAPINGIPMIVYCAKNALETGLDVYLSDSLTKIKVNNSFYFPVIVNDSIKLDPQDKIEIKEAKWISIEEASQLNLNRDTRIILKTKINLIKKILENR